jgi:hypothetical protein
MPAVPDPKEKGWYDRSDLPVNSTTIRSIALPELCILY